MRLLFSLAKNFMSHFKYRSNRKVKFAIGFIGVVLILAAASAAAFRARRPAAVPKPVVAAQVVQQTTAPEARATPALEVLPIQLRRFGFVPLEITRPPGDYLLSVGNQSGSSEIDLGFQREHLPRLFEGRIKRERLRWRQKVNLTPGTYLITEASHPDWVCRIVIK